MLLSRSNAKSTRERWNSLAEISLQLAARTRGNTFRQSNARSAEAHTKEKRTVRVRDDGDEHIQHHDDDERHVHDEEHELKVAGEHVAIEVSEHTHVEHREKSLMPAPEGLARGRKESA